MNNRSELAPGNAQPVIETRGLTKVYDSSSASAPAVNRVDLKVRSGEFVAIMGASGSGKSTLLYLIAGLATPTSGEVLINGVPISSLPDAARAHLRNTRIGFVFQRFNLLGFLSAKNNIESPRLLGWRQERPPRSVDDLLAAVGLEKKNLRRVNELSAGEQQRVAIARALINNPDILLADEPTGNLDSKNAAAVLDLILRLKSDLGLTTLMVTHNPDVALRADRVVEMKDGMILRELTPDQMASAAGGSILRVAGHSPR
ncbi:MAG: ABC transporter ATP-binding protein [Acidobacteria bacterium]|nr:ABC transporter ATP-binding protein [Acidobacteriota bacterium]